MTDRYFRSGSGIIKTIPELLDARDQRHRIYEVHGTTDTGIVSLRYSPLPLMSRAPVGAPPADDWAAIEETLRAEVKERGCFPHPKHHDPQWRSVRAVARSFAGMMRAAPGQPSRPRVNRLPKFLSGCAASCGPRTCPAPEWVEIIARQFRPKTLPTWFSMVRCQPSSVLVELCRRTPLPI